MPLLCTPLAAAAYRVPGTVLAAEPRHCFINRSLRPSCGKARLLPTTAVTNHHEFSGLTQHRSVTYGSGGNGSDGVKVEARADLRSFWGLRGTICFLPFRLLEAPASLGWLTLPRLLSWEHDTLKALSLTSAPTIASPRLTLALLSPPCEDMSPR